ncbi:MAG TPA: hypothetical protein PKC39_14635 [Ferruginibacter sp.]|nr:hypothetical protein [Ferruginibacter sp.]HMP22193.1 hypothetical protein [Ferruginibacter sp.]
MNQAQYKAAYAIIAKHGLPKEEIVSSISNGRTSSMRQLSDNESIFLIQFLKQEDERRSAIQGKDVTAMRGKILYYCHQMGWTKTNPSGKKVADVQRFDEWATRHSYLKKKLNQYSYAELPKLVSQFALVYKSFLKAF